MNKKNTDFLQENLQSGTGTEETMHMYDSLQPPNQVGFTFNIEIPINPDEHHEVRTEHYC